MLKGVVRAERLDNPADFIQPIIDRVKKDYLQRHFSVADWTDHIDFLTQIAVRCGRLGKGGEPDINMVAVGVINDWQRVSEQMRERECVDVARCHVPFRASLITH